MTTVSFSMSRTILVETEDRDPADFKRRASEVTFQFALDSPPPAEGVTITLTSDATQIFNAFVLGFTEADIQVVGGDRPVPDFDFSAFDFNITSQNASITFRHFDDEDDVPDPTSPFPSYDGFREVTFFVPDGDDYDVDPGNKEVLVWFADERSQLPANAQNPSIIDIPGNESPTTGEIVGTKGSDKLQGTKDDDDIQGLGGKDTLLGLKGDDIISGGGGKDTIKGGGGNDEINGGGGKDNIKGGGGRDTLYGGGGSDIIAGNGGNDIYVLEKKGGRDTFKGFKLGKDTLGLSKGLTFDDLTFTAQGRDTLIKAGRNSLAVLERISPDAIAESNFVDV